MIHFKKKILLAEGNFSAFGTKNLYAEKGQFIFLKHTFSFQNYLELGSLKICCCLANM
jgi:hypothetical protein